MDARKHFNQGITLLGAISTLAFPKICLAAAASLSLSHSPLYVAPVVEPNVFLTASYEYPYNELMAAVAGSSFGELTSNSGSLNFYFRDDADVATFSTTGTHYENVGLVFPWPSVESYSTCTGGFWSTNPVTKCTPIDVYGDGTASTIAAASSNSAKKHFLLSVPEGNDSISGSAPITPSLSTTVKSFYSADRITRSLRNSLYFNYQAVSEYTPWPDLSSRTTDSNYDGSGSVLVTASAFGNSSFTAALNNPQDSSKGTRDLTIISGSGFVPNETGYDDNYRFYFQPLDPRNLTTDGSADFYRYTISTASGEWRANWYTGYYPGNPNTTTCPTAGGGDAYCDSLVDLCKKEAFGRCGALSTSGSYNKTYIKERMANWYTYYRSADLVSKGILLKVLKGIKDRGLNSRFRVGLILPEGTPNPETGTAMADGIYAPKIATHAHLANLAKAALAAKGANRFYSYDSGAETITGRAEQYYSTLAAYQETDGSIRSCRRNYEIMLFPDHTTVDWRFKIGTSANPGPLYTAINKYGVAAANSDNCTDTFSDGSLYCPQPSAVAGTFADLVWTGWRTDLINLDNTILTSRRDPATWQHVSRYVIAPYGVSNITPAIDETAQKTWYSTSYPRYDTFEDVYHMALNGRGRFYTYESMDKATEGVLEAFFDILTRNTTGSAVATNTTALVTSGTVYQAALDNDWRGRMRAYGITLSGNAATIGATPNWDGAYTVSAQSLTYSSGTVDTGDIADRRRIFTSVDQVPKAFRRGSFSDPQLDSYGLTGDSGSSDKERYGRLMINYLRGYAACEQTTACGTYADTSGTTRSLEFRRRQLEINEDKRTIITSKQPDGRNTLGDIANSSPWYIGPPLIGLSDVDYPGYNAHYRANKNRRPVVYVGGNDGMLHAFDGTTSGCSSESTCNSVGAGRELFAYIPSLVLPNLSLLASKSYTHRYFADGSPFSAEVYSNEAWRTVLIGGLNRGGKGYYALDVTTSVSDSADDNWVGEASVTVNSHISSSYCNGGCSTTYSKLPTTSTRTIEDHLAEDKFLWEFTEADMGYTYNFASANPATGQARQIVRTKAGEGCSTTDNNHKNDCKWAVIVGNGYNDTAGSPAALYVIFLDGPGNDKVWDSGTEYVKIPVGTVAMPHTSYDDGLNTNGLSTPTPYDADNDGFVDYVYAGDINGNLWKFDINSNDTSSWAVSHGGKPVFVAKDGSGTPKRQPIIAPPLIIKHTATQKPLILFGTGKLIDSTDVTNTDTQSFYAVLDHPDSQNTSLTRSSLFPRTATTLSVNDGSAITSNNLRVMNQNSFAYCTASNPTTCTISNDDLSSNDSYFGWYWDMPTSGERITGVPQPVRTEVRFNTYIPNLSDPCQYGGDGWAMCLNMQTGLQGCKSSTITLPTEYQYRGLSLFGGRRTGAAIGGASFIPTLGGDLVVIDSAMGQSNESVPRASIEDGGGYKGRVSWYELTD